MVSDLERRVKCKAGGRDIGGRGDIQKNWYIPYFPSPLLPSIHTPPSGFTFHSSSSSSSYLTQMSSPSHLQHCHNLHPSANHPHLYPPIIARCFPKPLHFARFSLFSNRPEEGSRPVQSLRRCYLTRWVPPAICFVLKIPISAVFCVLIVLRRPPVSICTQRMYSFHIKSNSALILSQCKIRLPLAIVTLVRRLATLIIQNI